ncbi:hypothetical protein [Archaeoglobus sp.]
MSEVRVELNNIRCPDWYPKGRKISRHSRKLNGDTFVAPRIILPPEYNDLIGQLFFLWDADVEVEYEEFWRRKRIKGKALILVVPGEIEEVRDEEDEEEWDEEGWDE